MEIPDLFEEVYVTLIDAWHKELEEADSIGYAKTENQVKAQLDEKTDAETQKLLKIYSVLISDKIENIYCEICRRLFLFSVKAGMGLQKAFDEEN